MWLHLSIVHGIGEPDSLLRSAWTLHDRDMITGAQIKTARKLLGWDRTKLSHMAGVTTHTIAKAEGTARGIPPTHDQLAAMRRTLEVAGVEFIEGNGSGVSARLRKDKLS